MLKDISIKAKLTIMVALPVIGLIFITLFALQELKLTEAGSKRIYHDRVVPLEDLKIIADDYAVLVIDAINKANAGIFTLDQTIKDIESSKQEIDLKWQAYLATDLSDEERQLANEAQTLFVSANTAIDNALQTLNRISGSPEGQLDALDGPLYAHIDPISEKVTELINLQLRVAKQEYETIQQVYAESVLMLSVLSIVIMVLLIAISTYIYRSMMTPLSHMQETIERISESSDLTLTLHTEGKNELGTISRSFNTMIAQVREMVSQISSATNRLANAATDMTNVSVETKSSINTQRAEIEQVSAAMNEMAATSQEISRNAEQADTDARNTKDKAQLGSTIVNQAVVATNALVTDVQSVSGKIKTLESDSENIGSIIDVIKSVAEQTNLLALNAAIEAARAGDQGRGFAVVADEVRTLAQRTQVSTQEIQEAIERLQSGISDAVTAMDEGQEKAEITGAKATEAGRALEDISTAVLSITDMNALISSASNEQASVSEEINQSLINLHNASNTSSHSAEKISLSSAELNALSNELKAMITKFRVN